MHLSPFSRSLPIGAAVAASFFLATLLHAQAQFAGTYVGVLGTRVTVPIVGSVEATAALYTLTVNADGTVSWNGGLLTGNVNASGAISFTGGNGLAQFGIRSATIANNQVSSTYGDAITTGGAQTQYRLLPSTSFTAVTGGGSGSGGGGTGTGGGSSAGGDLLVYYSFNDTNNLLRDDSGRGFTLTPVGGIVTPVAGRAGGGINTTNVRLRAAVNSTFSVRAYTISYFVKVTGTGNWNPRMVAVQVPGTSTHYYGTYLHGTQNGNRQWASYHLSGRAAKIFLSTAGSGSLPTSSTADWQHVAVTNDGTTVTQYLNGNPVGTQANAGAIDSFSTAMLMIAGSDNGLDLFTGQLDEIRIYNRALTSAEITSLRNATAVGTAASGVNTAAAVVPPTAIAAPYSLTGYRNRVGQSFELTVTGANTGALWGTDVYTDDSSVASAAVHAGVLASGETKTVTVTILPGQSSYPGSVRNGVSSSNWGAWSGSFSFAGSAGTTFTTAAAATPPALPAGFRAASLNVIPGGRFVIPIPVTGTGPFSYQWFRNGTAIPAASGGAVNPYVVNTVTAAHAGTYTVRVTSPGGTQTFTAGALTVPPNASAPQIVLQPFDKIVAPGDRFALAASAVGNGLAYQWLRNGNVIPAAAGGTNAILLRTGADATDAGTYSVRITGGGSTVTSTPATVEINPNASRLANLSGRIAIGGDAQVIPGFVIMGTGKKRVLVRAVGPGLAPLGVGDTMPDPKLELYDGTTRIGANDNWAAANAAVFAAVGAFGLPANSNDAALVAELDAGKPYTMVVQSNNGRGGVVLFEVYDAGNVSGASKFVNVSVRGPTGAGDSTLILGFNIQGAGKRTLLARGVGPQLASFGITDRIADPKLEIFDSNTRSVLVNNDWNGADFVAEMLQAAEFVGAFGLEGGSADAATLALLDPGSYTMQISANSGSVGGEAVVEIYEVP